ncbi:flagellar hook assembly protein FlgD [Shouchella shacheensis]|uniref:flagellar hook assembly protein FlgD n=1 Tax=Shouchella shacheensis TaxID=1649580 RepID=UPI00073FF76D|nr:flagellar hook assembly protein FlgD [Shouchella shacheensis]
MPSIDPTLMLESTRNQVDARQSGNNLGQDAFLKLLITQLQNQDPTNPIEDREFIAQLATFSQLEQLTSLNTGMQHLYLEKKSQELISFSELIGKEVEWQDETGSKQVGVVEGVKYNKEGTLVVGYGEDKWVEASRLTSITNGLPKTENEKGNDE